MTSAVEEEIGEMYINAREDVQQIISLIKMEHP